MGRRNTSPTAVQLHSRSTKVCVDGVLRFAPHRTLKLKSGSLALLAERSTGWCLINSYGYSYLCERLRDGWDAAEVDASLAPVINELWTSGLLLRGTSAHPDTQRQKEAYPSSLLLKLTGACNLGCTYCYDYDTKRFRANLTLDRVMDVIRLLLSKREGLSLVFHGGEPLLRFDLVQQIVDSALRLAGDSNRLRFSMQTNGTLFTPQIVRFLEDHRFSVGISLDSNEDTGNSLRVDHRNQGTVRTVTKFLESYSDFVRERCGFLAVVSRTSVRSIPEFALWLQSREIRNLTISFLDLSGRAQDLPAEKVTPSEAVGLYSTFIGMIRRGEIGPLALRSLISRIENLFTFQPRDFCHRGPCAASDEFLVVDAEGVMRSCDCIYHPYFVLGPESQKLVNISGDLSRDAIIDRHDWLRQHGPDCRTCALFGLCGGTCVAKALANHGTPNSVDPNECEIARYVYPELLEEFDQPGPKPLLNYYHRHRLSSLPALA
jgi:uncharacterized protein